MTQASSLGDLELENRIARAMAVGVRAIVVLTVEDERALVLAEALAERMGLTLHTWSVAAGVDRGGRERELGALLARLSARDADEIWLLFEAGRELRGSAQRRMLRELAQSRHGPTLLLIESERASIPDIPELEIEALPLPEREQLRERVRWIAEEIAVERSILAEALARADERIAAAGVGLTLDRFDRVVAEAVLGDAATPASVVAALDRRRIGEACGQSLELVDDAVDDSLVGFGRYLEWLRDRTQIRERLRGVGLLGAPGCGRRHAARIGAKALGLPLLRTHPALAGDREALRSTLAALERAAPVALIVDDSEHPDTLAAIARWHAIRDREVFMFVVSMRPEQLPPAWRDDGLDARFFVDLPSAQRRAELLVELLTPSVADPPLLDLARAAQGCSASDLAVALGRARLRCLAQARPLSAIDLESALAERPPLAVREATLLESLRAWAAVHALTVD